MATNVNDMSGSQVKDYGDPFLGAHYGRYVGFAYVGIQNRDAYQGQTKSPCGKVIHVFELLDDFITMEENGQQVQRPRCRSKIENAFNGPNANNTKIYNTLDPTMAYGGDFAAVAHATVPCIVNIEQKRDRQTNQPIAGTKIGSIGSVPPGTEAQLPAVQNPPMVFDFDEPTPESWAGLKKWMRDMVRAANNFAGSRCEQIANQYEAQQQQGQGQAPATPAPAQQAQAPAQAAPAAPAPDMPAGQGVPPAPPTTAPVQSAPAIPAAPPGFRYDAATNSFVPDVSAGNVQAGTPTPPSAAGVPAPSAAAPAGQAAGAAPAAAFPSNVAPAPAGAVPAGGQQPY